MERCSVIFQENLELESDIITLIEKKIQENKEKILLQNNKKRNWIEMTSSCSKPINDEFDISTKKFKKNSEEVSDTESNEIGFKNVKQKIDNPPLNLNSNKISEINTNLNTTSNSDSLLKGLSAQNMSNSKLNIQKSATVTSYKDINIKNMIDKYPKNNSNLSFLDTSDILNTSQRSVQSNSQTIPTNLVRQRSQGNLPRGINSRLANNTMQFISKTKRQKTGSRKRTNLKLVDQMLDKINKAQLNSKRKTSDVDNKSSVNNSDNIKRIINKQFYAKEKDLKTPSPAKSIHLKYSKRKIDENDNSNVILTTNTNTNHLDTSTNLNIIESDHSNLTNLNQTKNISTNTSKSNTPIGNKFSILRSNVRNSASPINLNTKKAEVVAGKKSDKSDESDDEVLVYSTPNRVENNLNFSKKSPNMQYRLNLIKLFDQMNKK